MGTSVLVRFTLAQMMATGGAPPAVVHREQNKDFITIGDAVQVLGKITTELTKSILSILSTLAMKNPKHFVFAATPE